MKWFTADPHFRHERVLEMCKRPFENIDEHDDHLILKINECVKPDDELWILGDFQWTRTESIVERIVCKRKHLVIGNHDRAANNKMFKSWQDVAMIKVGDSDAFLSHYPHAYWPASHYGSLHLYGHLHYRREETLDIAFPGLRSMDVGVDTAKVFLGEYRPFSEAEILSILLKRPGHDPVEFYRRWEREHEAPEA